MVIENQTTEQVGCEVSSYKLHHWTFRGLRGAARSQARAGGDLNRAGGPLARRSLALRHTARWGLDRKTLCARTRAARSQTRARELTVTAKTVFIARAGKNGGECAWAGWQNRVWAGSQEVEGSGGPLEGRDNFSTPVRYVRQGQCFGAEAKPWQNQGRCEAPMDRNHYPFLQTCPRPTKE